MERKKSIVREKLCKKAHFIYEPSGLITEIPPSWSCPIDKVLLDVYKKLSSQSLNIDESGDALNIVLVGNIYLGWDENTFLERTENIFLKGMKIHFLRRMKIHLLTEMEIFF